MTVTVLYSEAIYADEAVEVALFGPDVRILVRDTDAISDLSDEDCARADGLMLFRHWLSAADLARFTRLRGRSGRSPRPCGRRRAGSTAQPPQAAA